MESIALPPRAAALSHSLRDLGYSLETAIADIIDNSIAAGATKVDIWCSTDATNPDLAIIDNGKGMVRETLIESMRYGSRGPSEPRSAGDLGRFGLGLKTASFSQCSHLCVVSRKDGVTSGAVWDLEVLSKDEWSLGMLDDTEIGLVPWLDRLGATGTMVLWRNLDRLSERQSDQTVSTVLAEKLSVLENHLGLVFHRFLSGDLGPRRKLALRINGHPVKAFDPFFRANRASQMLPDQSVLCEGQRIAIQPWVIPHHSKLDREEYSFYTGRSEYLSNQGAYVYRNGRLMAWGDWFRLVPRSEATKLARVQIDFPTELDEMWTIDIKKSRAFPPPIVRDQLRQVIGRITSQSTRVIRKRSDRLFDPSESPLWMRQVQGTSIAYRPDLEHPMISAFEQTLSGSGAKQFRTILDMIGSSLPVEAIHTDYSVAPRGMEEESAEWVGPGLSEKLVSLRSIVDPDNSMAGDRFAEIARSTRMFEHQPDVLESFLKKEFST